MEECTQKRCKKYCEKKWESCDEAIILVEIVTTLDEFDPLGIFCGAQIQTETSCTTGNIFLFHMSKLPVFIK